MLLADRLVQRGLVLSAGTIAAALAQNVASASVPPSLLTATVKTAGFLAAGNVVVASIASPKVLALADGVMKAMLLNKIKKIAAVMLDDRFISP
jgi:hypothetical protein